MNYNRPNRFYYRIAQIAAWFVASIIFRRKIIRNAIRGKKGPYVVIANHEAALDFVNLIGATSRPMSFVISRSFYNTLPVKGIMDRIGVIPKQQFQTTVRDMKRMKAVIDAGQPLVIYPAGLMCEDGLSTPIPSATYKFLKWLGADVYVARIRGSYFVMPKWTKGFRPGRTSMDIYPLFTKEELAELDETAVKERTDAALLFDAYRDQETMCVKYFKNTDLRGMENVLYRCPHCGREFTIHVRDKNTLFCSACGFAETGDAYGFLHNSSGIGKEIRYVSDWSRDIYCALRDEIQSGREITLESCVDIHMIDHGKKKFTPVGDGVLKISGSKLYLNGTIHNEKIHLEISISNIPTLPFSPGRHLEVQHGEMIYRCLPEDGRQVMKFINLVKIDYDLRKSE